MRILLLYCFDTQLNGMHAAVSALAIKLEIDSNARLF